MNAILKDNPKSAKSILFELYQQTEETFTQNSNNRSVCNNEPKSTNQEWEEHLEENIVEHLHKCTDFDYDEMCLALGKWKTRF